MRINLTDLNSTEFMLSKINKLINIKFSKEFDTRNITSMKGFFYGCNNLKSIDIHNLNTENVEDMSYMFSQCLELNTILYPNSKTSKIKNMNYMFEKCSHLSSINLTSFSTQNLELMSNTFYGCSSLNLIDLSNFNTKNIKDMSSLFKECYNLTSIKFSNFSTYNLQKMNNMFQNCSSLENLPNISEWNISSNTDSYNMFLGCELLSENMRNKKPKFYKFLRISKKFIDCICSRYCDYCYCIIIYIYIIIFLFCFQYQLIPLENSNSIRYNKTNESIINPTKYFNLCDSFNITHIVSIYKDVNPNLISQISEDKEGFINQALNFTKIHGDIKIEKDLKFCEIYSSLILYIYLINVIINIYESCDFKIKCIKLQIYIIFFTILLTFNAISIILEILELIIINKLESSIDHFYYLIILIFQIQIPEDNMKEYLLFQDSKKAIYYIIFVSLLSISEIFLLCKHRFNKKQDFYLNSYNDYLTNINDYFNLDE
jgi:surface protein